MSDANRESDRPTIDLLTLLADDKQIVLYRPRWNEMTGSVNATILLQQMIYRWIGNGRRPFYKFGGPCSHPLYKPGDSWEEELGMSRREFETARKLLAARTRGEIDAARLVSYWVNRRHSTWYALNEQLLLSELAKIYPDKTSGSAGIQMSLPGTNENQSYPQAVDNFGLSMADSANSTDGGNAHRSGSSMAESAISTDGGNAHRSGSSMAESAISTNGGNAHPSMAESANSTNGGIRHQINKEYYIDNKQKSLSEKTTAATTGAAAAKNGDNAVAVVADLETIILDWMGFNDLLNEKDRKHSPTLADFLGWAFWVKLESPRLEAAGKNAIGIARSNWRRGKAVADDLRQLAEVWLAMNDEERDEVLWACSRYGYLPDRLYLPEDFPHYVPYAALKKLYRELDGEIVPPALMPPEPEEGGDDEYSD